MGQFLAHVAPIVRDYDEAIAWFTGVLGFTLIANQHHASRTNPSLAAWQAA